MKAVYRYGFEPRQTEMRDLPTPIAGDDDVIIEVKAAGICGSDVGSYFGGGSKGGIGIIGHEFAGKIAEVGKHVTDWHVGERVVSDNTGHVCGKCHACTSGQFLYCPERIGIGYGMDGGFAKYVKIPGDVLQIHKCALMHIADNISYEHAALMDPICNAYKAVAQESGLLPGEDLLVFGPGPIGLLASQIGHVMGAKNIILVGLDVDKKTRSKVAQAMGVTKFIASDTEDLDNIITEISGKDGVPVAIDCAGAPVVLQQAIRNVRTGGRIVKLGVNNKALDFSLTDFTYKAISLKGHKAYDVTSWRNCLGLLEKNMLVIDPLITHTLPLDEWEKGMSLMSNREGIKIILKP